MHTQILSKKKHNFFTYPPMHAPRHPYTYIPAHTPKDSCIYIYIYIYIYILSNHSSRFPRRNIDV